ncbi:hypothetical protein BD626DRAFT_571441 [Schizophyllum amplum]|uniref:Uncharacterized protein n=1 Tax=Schizophyllum amplum TaxID=97359 RepID=A0A550C7E8_9AGAR|nr:hypothetical protein BD626DRAFT_571441 [Auriculariopsis ampla]
MAVDLDTAASSLFADRMPETLEEDIISPPPPDLSHTPIPPLASSDFTIVFPVLARDLILLQDRLSDILHSSSSFGPRSQYEGHLREVLVVCPEDALVQTKSIIQQSLLNHEESTSPQKDVVEISVHSASSRGIQAFPDSHILHIAADMISTPWVYFDDVQSSPQIVPVSDSSKPFGIRGFSSTSSLPACMAPSASPEGVSYLVPPFAISTERLELVMHSMDLSMHEEVWQSLGYAIGLLDGDHVGGILAGSDDGYCASYRRKHDGLMSAHILGHEGLDNSIRALYSEDTDQVSLQNVEDPSEPPKPPREHVGRPEDAAFTDYLRVVEQFIHTPMKSSGTVFAVLPSLDDFRASAYLFCQLAQHHHATLAILLTRETAGYSETALTDEAHTCQLPYHLARSRDDSSTGIRLWLDTLQAGRYNPDVIILSSNIAPADVDEPSTNWIQSRFPDTAVIRLPQADLRLSDWMGVLTLTEWKNWHKPEVEASIITRDRPQSLQRLLTSLTDARFYGDRLNVRINLEQDADAETFAVVERFATSWPHGVVSVQHRVVRGGLLPAVVESWYPRTDDSHGLLLEDDVELSPLFYAWAKMALLHYRYGAPENTSPHLFGISLYQQKSNELHADGRRAFDARALFAAHPDVETTRVGSPYLSQVPCSWGAVYFPGPWRSFHSYLALRLSGRLLPLDIAVAPGVRSNAWSRSWKKFFIELVYLDGGAMLYPNYAGWASLSTNHLERGSHVKVRSREKREMFQVPLMEGVDGGSGLLADMPGRVLPGLGELPVLNLTGSVVSLEEIAEVGRMRKEELQGCWKEGDAACEAGGRDTTSATT